MFRSSPMPRAETRVKESARLIIVFIIAKPRQLYNARSRQNLREISHRQVSPAPAPNTVSAPSPCQSPPPPSIRCCLLAPWFLPQRMPTASSLSQRREYRLRTVSLAVIHKFHQLAQSPLGKSPSPLYKPMQVFIRQSRTKVPLHNARTAFYTAPDHRSGSPTPPTIPRPGLHSYPPLPNLKFKYHTLRHSPILAKFDALRLQHRPLPIPPPAPPLCPAKPPIRRSELYHPMTRHVRHVGIAP